jgi:hypothetical protein
VKGRQVLRLRLVVPFILATLPRLVVGALTKLTAAENTAALLLRIKLGRGSNTEQQASSPERNRGLFRIRLAVTVR